MKFVVVVLFALVGAAVVDSTPIWANCQGVSGSITLNDVAVQGCTGPPCVLKKGTNASVTITFTPNDDVKEIYNQVYGIIAGIKVKFPGYPDSQKDVCKLGVACPVAKGTKVSEKVMLPVDKSDPKIEVVAEWRLTSDVDGKDILACFDTKLDIES